MSRNFRRGRATLCSMRRLDSDFEFERRFLVENLPFALLEDQQPNVIVQTYFLAEDGFALRIRLQATHATRPLPLSVGGKSAIELFASDFDLCMLTAKGPAVGGTRYEAERELDIGVGIEMCLRGGRTVTKRRFGIWLDEDGWVLDQFCGENAPLIIAECERTSPVTDLAIPTFCHVEVTDDPRFSNDSLAKDPYGSWQSDSHQTPSALGGRFREEFGENTPSSL